MHIKIIINLQELSCANWYTIGGRTLARRKPYKNDIRKPSNRTRSKRIYKNKAIIKRKQGIDKQLLNVKVID
jgi:hypothetical protein